MKLTGEQVREWLERSAAQFNTIDPDVAEPQPLISETHPSYNFDVIDGVEYVIDVTEPSRYDDDGALVNPDAERIVELTRDGEPVEPDDEFVVVTNNYRASGGGSFPGLDGSTIIVEGAADEPAGARRLHPRRRLDRSERGRQLAVRAGSGGCDGDVRDVARGSGGEWRGAVREGGRGERGVCAVSDSDGVGGESNTSQPVEGRVGDHRSVRHNERVTYSPAARPS